MQFLFVSNLIVSISVAFDSDRILSSLFHFLFCFSLRCRNPKKKNITNSVIVGVEQIYRCKYVRKTKLLNLFVLLLSLIIPFFNELIQSQSLILLRETVEIFRSDSRSKDEIFNHFQSPIIIIFFFFEILSDDVNKIDLFMKIR